MYNIITKSSLYSSKKKLLLLGIFFLMLFSLFSLLQAQTPRNSGGAWIFYYKTSADGDDPTVIFEKLRANLGNLKDRMRTLKTMGAQYIRLWIPWSLVERSEGIWDEANFNKLNKIIGAIVRKGLKLQVTLCTLMSPHWLHQIMENDPFSYFHVYYDPNESDLPKEKPENHLGDKHQLKQTEVNSPHMSIWHPEARIKIKRFVDKCFNRLLKKWSPHVIYVNLSLGRLNEPTYPDKNYFFCYDLYAKQDFREFLQNNFSTIQNINNRWGTNYGNFNEIDPPKEPFEDIDTDSENHKNHRKDFIKWYRNSKRNWVKTASSYVTNHLKPWQKYVIYVAGGDDIRDQRVNDDQPYYEKFINEGWGELTNIQKKTLKHMQDNRWIFSTSKAKGWYVQYAGIGANCGENSGCYKMPDYAQETGYNGPIYGQIPGLNVGPDEEHFELIDIVTVGNFITNKGYTGLHFNKDSDINFTSNPATHPKKVFHNDLKTAWYNISSYYQDIPTSLEQFNIDVSTFTNSASIEWATDRKADSCIIYGTEIESLLEVSEYRNYDSKVESHSITLNGLTSGRRYYYKLTNTDKSGTTTVNSSSNYFATRPAAPVLVAPINGIETNHLRVVFRWEASTEEVPITHYQLQIYYDDETVSGPPIEIPGNVTSYELKTEEKLNCGTIYKWKLRAENESGWGPRSSFASFETPGVPEQAPTVIKPTNYEVTNTLKPVLKWNTAISTLPVTEYEIRVYHNNGTGAIPATKVGNVTSYNLVDKLTCNRTYYWRVRVYNQCGASSWSPRAYFKTPPPPQAPTVIKPKDNQTTNTLKPVFKWNPVQTIFPVTEYQILILKNNGTGVYGPASVGNVTQWQIGFKLNPGKTYKWQVRAKNDCAWGDWCPLAFFKTPQ